MARNIWLVLLAANLGLVGCQNAKMSTAPKKQQNTYNGYYQGQRPIPRQNPPYYPSPMPQQQQQQNPGVVTIPRVEDDSQTYVENTQTTYGRPLSAEDYVGELNPLAQTGQRPQFEQENEVEYYDFRKIPRLLDTCREGCALPEPTPPKDTCREGTECEEKKPILGQCAPIHLNGKSKAQKLDILFVVDTSKSMRSKKKETKTSELEDLVSQMKSFIKQLDADADYNIGVLLGHSPATSKSPTNFFGKLYSNGASDSEILSIGKYIAEGKAKGLTESEARKQAENKIVAALKKKFSNLATDPKAVDKNDAYGEVGLLSLYQAMTDSHALRDLQGDGNRNEGLMREGAALNVIFVSDENDACYDYDAVGIKPRVNDPKEVKTFGSICKTGGPNGQRLTEDDVLQALRKAKGDDKVILSAVIYNNEKTLPALGPNDENDIGHGYKELVEKAHGDQNTEKGPLADLAKRDFGTLMGQIGEFAQEEMNYVYRFECVTNVSSKNITTPFDMLVKKNGKTIGHFNTGCGYNTKSGGKIKGVCPVGAFPIKPTTKKEKIEKSDAEKQIVINIEPDSTPEGKSSRQEIQRIQDSLDEDGATVEITFTKMEEDGISNVEQLQYLKSQIPMAQRQSQVTKEENETDSNSDSDKSSSNTTVVVPKPNTQVKTSTPTMAGTGAVTPKPNTTVKSSTPMITTATGKTVTTGKVNDRDGAFGNPYVSATLNPPGVTTLPTELKKKSTGAQTKAKTSKPVTAKSATTLAKATGTAAKTTNAKAAKGTSAKSTTPSTTTSTTIVTRPTRHQPLTPYERMMKNQEEKSGVAYPARPTVLSSNVAKAGSTQAKKPNFFERLFLRTNDHSMKRVTKTTDKKTVTTAKTIAPAKNAAPVKSATPAKTNSTTTAQKSKSNLGIELNKFFSNIFGGSKKRSTHTGATAVDQTVTTKSASTTHAQTTQAKKTTTGSTEKAKVKSTKMQTTSSTQTKSSGVKTTSSKNVTGAKTAGSKTAGSKTAGAKTTSSKTVAPKTSTPNMGSVKVEEQKTAAPKADVQKIEAPKVVAPSVEAPRTTVDNGGPHGGNTFTAPAPSTTASTPAKKNLYPPAPSSEDEN